MGITITTAIPSKAGISTTGAGILQSGVWHHMAFAFHSPTNFAVYIDFVKRTTSSFNDVFEEGYVPVPVPEVNLESGWRSRPNGDHYTGFGLLDEVAVFSQVMSASQIMQLQISN